MSAYNSRKILKIDHFYNDLFLKLHSFLLKYQKISEKELLIYYPTAIDDYDVEWINYLQSKTTTQLWQFDSLHQLEIDAPPSLKSFIKEIEDCCQIPFIRPQTHSSQLPDWAWKGVKYKKRHEIEIVLQHLNINKENTNKSYKLIDLCGGKGHASRLNSFYYGVDSLTIDYNEDLIKLGKKRKIKYPIPKESGEFNFQIADLKNRDQINKVLKDQSRDDLFLYGLHTCGDLALDFLSTFKSNKNICSGFLNFGCCYHNLNPQKDVSLSKIAKMNKINFSKHSLTLATRSNFGGTLEQFHKKIKVKYYRYAFQLFLYHEYDIKHFTKLGSQSLPFYLNSTFEEYAILNLNILKLPIPKKNLLNLFFKDTKIQKLLEKMIVLTIIRWQLARPLEIYILLDRYFMMKEEGFDVNLFQYFNQKISPRNIGIDLRY